MPDEGRQVSEFLETPELMQAAMDMDSEDWTNDEVTWKVPGFAFGTCFKLEEILKAMGMERMFGDEAEESGRLAVFRRMQKSGRVKSDRVKSGSVKSD